MEKIICKYYGMEQLTDDKLTSILLLGLFIVIVCQIYSK